MMTTTKRKKIGEGKDESDKIEGETAKPTDATTLSWSDLQSYIFCMSENELLNALHSERRRDRPRENYLIRFYTRYSKIRRRRETAEWSIPTKASKLH